MSKAKAYFITIVIMALAGVLIWAFWNFNIRSYWVVVQLLALYGFAVGGVHLAHWLAKPAPEESDPGTWYPPVIEDEQP